VAYDQGNSKAAPGGAAASRRRPFIASSPVLPYSHDPFRMTPGKDGAATSSRTTRPVPGMELLVDQANR
jgi:hypothetical protein